MNKQRPTHLPPLVIMATFTCFPARDLGTLLLMVVVGVVGVLLVDYKASNHVNQIEVCAENRTVDDKKSFVYGPICCTACSCSCNWKQLPGRSEDFSKDLQLSVSFIDSTHKSYTQMITREEETIAGQPKMPADSMECAEGQCHLALELTWTLSKQNPELA